MTAHSIYGGSSAHRWLACPGSVYLQALAPREERATNEAAERGTAMHDLGYKLLSKASFAVEGFSEEEIAMVEGYVAAIADLKRDKSLHEFPEVVVYAPSIHKDAFGSIDYLAYEESTKTLYVVDLKTGRSAVDAKDNMQLVFYALAALDTFKWPVLHFVLGIYQPTRSDIIDWWLPTMAEVSAYGLQMRDATKANTLAAGDHCKYCKAEGFCGKRRESMAIVKTPVANMNPQMIADTYDMLPQLKTWMESLEAEADELAKTGALPDHHLIEGKARPLAWKDPANVVQALKQLGLAESITHTPPLPPALKTPTQVAKAIGKDGATQLAGIAERPPSNMVIVRSVQSEAIRSLTDW